MKKYLLLLFLSLLAFQSQAQCPKTKYGIVPVWPIIWDNVERVDWLTDMSDLGMGYLHTIENWRSLQEMLDSNTFSTMIDNIEYAKNILGYDKYLFLFQNPATYVNSMPPYVCGSPWTDETVMRDIYGFVCNLLDSMHHVIDYFAFGGEVDLYFKTRPIERDSFLVVASNISDYIDQNYPEIKFGVVLTTRNGIQGDQSMWNLLKPISDMLVVTYWPITSSYHVIPSQIDSVGRDINDLLTAADTLPLVIKESGIPTHPALGGSEALQSYFVRETFIHTMYENQIEIVGYDFLADFDTTQVFYFQAYYNIWTSDFYYYIASLGLMDSLGVPKSAYQTYLDMLDTLCQNSAVNEPSTDIFQVYPNPVSDYLNIAWSGGQLELFLISVDGRILRREKYYDNNNLKLDISTLAAGPYFIRLIWEDNTVQEMLIIKEPAE